MKNICFIVLFIGISFNPSLAQKIAADIVFTNGKIYTVDKNNPFVDAVAIKDGKFLQAGTTRDIEIYISEQTKIIDLGGAFAMPGFIDDDVHPAQPYLQEEGGALLFPESFTKEQIAEAVAAYLKKTPDAPYIIGEKWGLGLFPNGRATKSGSIPW